MDSNSYETTNNDNNNNTNNDSANSSDLTYSIAYKDSMLTMTLTNRTDSFSIDLKFKIPNRLDIDEIIYRLCSFKEEQFLMLEIQDIDKITGQSTNRIYDLFKCLVCYDEDFKDTLRKELNTFIRTQNQAYYDTLVENALRENLASDEKKANVFSYWKKVLTNQHLYVNEKAENDTSSDLDDSLQKLKDNEMNLAKVYHSLIHSHHVLNVLKRERNYAVDLNRMLQEREAALRFVMDEAQLDCETARWKEKINHLKAKQKRNFKKFLQKLYEKRDQPACDYSEEDADHVEYELNNQFESLKVSVKEKFTSLPSSKSVTNLFAKSTKLEESYTIQLGAQLKSTHNLRLIRCDIFDFCKDRFTISDLEITSRSLDKKNEDIEAPSIEPQAIQTAMSLYSDKLCALVLLVENSFSNESNEETDCENESYNEASIKNAENWKYLVELCDKNGCEFHFPPIEEQKEQAFRYASMANKNASETKYSHMKIGDFYVTKHSNMSQVHSIFHLVANERKSVENSSVPTSPSTPNKTLKQPELSSRHPVILGLRNIIRTCITNNINTLTIPLLLTHEMNEDMTISWVMKRAELVLKCLKGFMIELVQWGAQDSRTIQFVVPQGLLDETFNSLSNLIPTIFREARAVNLV